MKITGRAPITADDVLSHPMRRAMMDHIIRSGGKAWAPDICIAFGIERRGILKNHTDRLAQFGLMTRTMSHRAGCSRALVLAITAEGREAIAAINCNPTENNPP
jgi:hypothetical protein